MPAPVSLGSPSTVSPKTLFSSTTQARPKTALAAYSASVPRFGDGDNTDQADLTSTGNKQTKSKHAQNPWKEAAIQGAKSAFNLRGLLADTLLSGIATAASLITGGLSLLSIPFIYTFGILWRFCSGAWEGYQNTKNGNPTSPL